MPATLPCLSEEGGVTTLCLGVASRTTYVTTTAIAVAQEEGGYPCYAFKRPGKRVKLRTQGR